MLRHQMAAMFDDPPEKRDLVRGAWSTRARVAILAFAVPLVAYAQTGQPSPWPSAGLASPREGVMLSSRVVHPLPLRELVERAWQVTRRAEAALSRRALIDSRALAAQALTPGPPELGFDVRANLPRWASLSGASSATERGLLELTPGVSVPVWLPGQRDARRQTVEREREAQVEDERVGRWQIAGQIREAAWDQALARGRLRVQAARHAAALELETDVARRVTAGDLAPIDQMLAQAERTAGESALTHARLEVELATSRLRQLAEADEVDTPTESAHPPAPEDIEVHPVLALARAAVQAAQAMRDESNASRRDPPRVGVAVRAERDGFDQPWRNSLRLGVSFPLDTEARNAPRVAAAQAALVESQIAMEQARRALGAEVDRALLVVEAARAAVTLEESRLAQIESARAALERAFRAGERGLPEVLRIRAQAVEASLSLEAARMTLGRAIARLNQARGRLP